MSILKVARMGHPVLRSPARTVDRSVIRSVPFQKLVDDMIDTMHEYHGVGLAAPQVHEELRVFVAMIDPSGEPPDDEKEAESQTVVVVNPEIITISDKTSEDWEGCLSIPDVRGRVLRPLDVHIRALDRDGNRIDLRAKNFSARVLLHEYDHLDGVLFLDRMKSFETLTFMDEYARYWVKEGS
jgi:peptide deformylase